MIVNHSTTSVVSTWFAINSLILEFTAVLFDQSALINDVINASNEVIKKLKSSRKSDPQLGFEEWKECVEEWKECVEEWKEYVRTGIETVLRWWWSGRTT